MWGSKRKKRARTLFAPAHAPANAQQIGWALAGGAGRVGTRCGRGGVWANRLAALVATFHLPDRGPPELPVAIIGQDCLQEPGQSSAKKGANVVHCFFSFREQRR